MSRNETEAVPPVAPPDIERALQTLAILLGEVGPVFELVIVGGAALTILGFISRPTKDVDVLGLRSGHDIPGIVKHDPLPPELAAAAGQTALDLGLNPNWLNAGPACLLDWGLPQGFESRLVRRSHGPRLAVHLPSRVDLIALKEAQCDAPG